MAIGHDKRDLLRSVSCDKTKLRNKNYNTTPNPAMKYAQCCMPVLLILFSVSVGAAILFGKFLACVAGLSDFPMCMDAKGWKLK
jgi:hypothetical protein